LTPFCVDGVSQNACSAGFDVNLIIADLQNNMNSISNAQLKDKKIMVFVFENDICSA